jgi:hypothetical protein
MIVLPYHPEIVFRRGLSKHCLFTQPIRMESGTHAIQSMYLAGFSNGA